MKTLKFILIAFAISLVTNINAQTADEILDTYFENMGGLDNWLKVEGVKMSATLNQGGMEIPLEIIQLKSGKRMTVINLQGQVLKQNVFDGETLWGTNFQTQKPEKNDAETTEIFKLEMNDFPDPFINYKEKGYTVEYLGKEDIEGTETFKIKLVKEPMMIDGVEEESVSFYFFDTENYIPIAVQSVIPIGPNKGMTSEATFSDYQEVDGLYFPFSMTQGLKGQGGQPINFDKIELNPVVPDEDFMFPKEAAVTDDGNDNKN